MMRRDPARRGRRRAFTLVEVLLVLVILVVIASLAVTAYGPIQRRAYINAAKTQIGAFETPLETYRLDVGDYPSTEQGLEALRIAPGDVPEGKWSGPYLGKDVPLDPWDQPYQYEYPGTHEETKPDIWSYGPDMMDGTDDDVGNWSTTEQ